MLRQALEERRNLRPTPRRERGIAWIAPGLLPLSFLWPQGGSVPKAESETRAPATRHRACCTVLLIFSQCHMGGSFCSLSLPLCVHFGQCL